MAQSNGWFPMREREAAQDQHSLTLLLQFVTIGDQHVALLPVAHFS